MLALPLGAALVIRWFQTRWSVQQAGWVASGAIGMAALGAIVLALSVPTHGHGLMVPLWQWMSIGNLTLSLGVQWDALSLLMAVMVTVIATLITVYAMGYMAHDMRGTSFFALVSFFVFWMLALVSADSLLGLFFGWEGVGLCSFLLIGFWHDTPSNRWAAIQAFVVNRVGDLGVWVALLVPLALMHPVGWGVLGAQVATYPPVLQVAVGLGIILAVCGKSAQGPLYVWLPNAMAGPTPVSALIHAATMVTAGVYLLARTHGFMPPSLQVVVMGLGLGTAFLGGVLALGQHDIKRVLAFSTMSQLGLMVMACGLGAYHAALFHMVTHACFKALLFLGAGSVIHGLNGEQSLARMGGLRRHMPITWVTVTIAVLAMMGVPPLSGFFSKDAILLAAWSHSVGLFLAVIGVSLLTACYMVRWWWLTFMGSPRYDATDTPSHQSPHESPTVMTVPLMLLAGLSVTVGVINAPLPWCPPLLSSWLSPLIPALDGHHGSLAVMALLGVGIASVGGWVGWWMAHRAPMVIAGGEQQWGLPWLLAWVSAHPIRWAGVGADRWVDRGLIKQSITGVSWGIHWLGNRVRRLHTGQLTGYLVMWVLALIAVLGSMVMAW